MSNTSKTVLITGATAGIGRMTALHLAKLGHHVIATGRKPAELAKLRAEATADLAHGTGTLDTLLLDVTSLASITPSVRTGGCSAGCTTTGGKRTRTTTSTIV